MAATRSGRLASLVKVDVFSLFPEIMQPYISTSILGRAIDAGLLSVALHDIRPYARDKHRMTDDVPYGGGGGMIMKPEPIFSAVESVLGDQIDDTEIILLTPQGRVFDQAVAGRLATRNRLALICGRYEGVDERVRDHLATDEISIGDFILTGGELPALVVVDAVARLLPGTLGDEQAAEADSHQSGLLEHPHYTRPAEFRGWEVPDVLRSGDHARIHQWRRRKSLARTRQRRPDLLEQAELSPEDRESLRTLEEEAESASSTHE